MPKLFKVTCLLTYCAVEEDERSAIMNASGYAREHIGDAPKPFDLVTATEITEKDEIPDGWSSSLPYGDDADGDRRVFSYLP